MKLPMPWLGYTQDGVSHVLSAAMSGAEQFPNLSCLACGGQHRLRDCPAVLNRSLVRSETTLAEMHFAQAFEVWLAARTVNGALESNVRYLGENSTRTYREYAVALGKFFGEDIKLKEIHDGYLRMYQDGRAANDKGIWRKRAGQNRIAREVGLLLRILRCAHVWSDDLEEAFQQLARIDGDIPRAPEPEQQEKLLRTMLLKDEWLWIYHYTVLALGTCVSTFELRMARFGDVNERNRTFRVGPAASKNKYRNRLLPLESEEIFRSAMFLKNRAARFGATEHDHYLFPYSAGRAADPDPTKPMTKDCMKEQWNRIRKRAGLPELRLYDLRHIAITRMAERGIGIHTIMAFAGHISERMQKHYVTISMQAKRAAARQMVEPSPFDKKAPASVEVWDLPVSAVQ